MGKLKNKLQLVLEEIRRRRQPKFRLEDFLFPKQLAFVRDPHPWKTAVCSRRAGKTVACAAHLIDTALKFDGVACLYVTVRRTNAKKIVWRELKRINRKYHLGGTPNESELSLTFANESVIYVTGAKDESEIEHIRGLPLKLCYVDETQSFRSYLEQLIDDVIAPALMDYDGTLCLIGTPGSVPTGYFHNCAVKLDSWSHHTWTFFDNPFIALKSGKTHQELLERELKRRGVTVDNPSIQREFFGRWVLDTNSLILHYTEEKNHYEKLPEGITWNFHILGVDIGFEDADALAVLAWSEESPEVYLIEELVTEKQDISALADQIELLRKKWNPYKIVIDAGALGKKIAEEIQRRFKIPLTAADKTRKMENIALLDAALARGHFKAKKTSRFAQDTYLVEVDREKSTPERTVISDRYHSDIIDAVLYAFKESPAYTWEPPVERPKHGTKEWATAEEERMFQLELARLEREENPDDPDFVPFDDDPNGFFF